MNLYTKIKNYLMKINILSIEEVFYKNKIKELLNKKKIYKFILDNKLRLKDIYKILLAYPFFFCLPWLYKFRVHICSNYDHAVFTSFHLLLSE